MCGIAGNIWPPDRPSSEDWMTVRDRLAPRGPDGAGHWEAPGVQLIHTRLAIIDLAHGAQPMSTADGSHVISYNGEIYNFRELREELIALGEDFETDSDTEVVLHAYKVWGTDCFLRFRGMFALCIYDVAKKEAVLARDPFGVKPLVFQESAQGFHFASELEALIAFDGVSPRISKEAVYQYFRYGYIAPPLTIYEGIRKLEPANWLRVDQSGAVVEKGCYWFPAFAPDPAPSGDEWLEAIDAALTTAVKRSLVADVPFGLFLSGGIDSSLVASKMAQVADVPVQAFCIGFEEEAYDESGGAKAIADYLGIPIDVMILNGSDVSNLDEIVSAYGEPFSDSSAVPTWSLCRMARQQVPMVLAGDGGDELFGGYARYDHWVENEWRTRKGCVHQLKRGKLLQAIGSARRHLRQSCTGSHWNEFIQLFSSEECDRLLGRGGDAYGESFSAAHQRFREQRPLSYAQGMDLVTYLPGDILAKVDIASMSCGLEVRPSLLDLDLVNLAFRIPDEMLRDKTRPIGLQGKAPLKALLGRELPREYWDRPKQGFALSHEVGFLAGGGLYKRLLDLLEDPTCATAEYLDAQFVRELLADHQTGKAQAHRLWAVLVFLVWMQKHPSLSAGPSNAGGN